MGLFKRNHEQHSAHTAGSSDAKATAGHHKRLPRWLARKGGQAGPDTTPAASSATGSSGIPQERSGDRLADPVSHKEPALTQSLWDCAYDALAKKDTELVKDYEMLLAKEAHIANDEPPAQLVPSRDMTCGPDGPRQAQLDRVIKQGLQRMEDTKTKYTIAGHEFVPSDQIAQAANLLLWAKDWIGDAVQVSPQASVAWAGVCLVLPLLTNPTTAAEASRDGFANVTVRLRYYIALEPLLCRLGQNAGVSDALMSEVNDHIVDLYEHILEFQLCSVLRFYQSRAKTYVRDMFSLKDWKQAALDIKAHEETVNKDLSQINELAARQEMEVLNKTSTDALGVMNTFLSVSTQHLAVSTNQLAVLQEQLALQRDAAWQKLSDEHKKCLQLFYHTRNDSDATYEWYKDRVEDRVQGTCQWFLQHDHFRGWLAQESGPLLVSADPGCGKSVLAKYLIDQGLAQQTATICYFFFKDQDQNTVRQALCALLHQLFSQKPALIQHAMESYNSKGADLTQSEKSLWTIFGNAVRDSRAGPVIIVLDALDECAESELGGLLQNVESLLCGSQSANTKLKFLLTSRPYEQILDEFWRLLDAFPRIRIPGEEESETISQEVNRVIQYRVDRLAKKQRLPDKIKSSLEERLLEIKHRTYLWVYLVFDYLDKGFDKTLKGVEAAIRTLPKSVNQVYERILNTSREDPMVRKVLSVILAASRPLTLSEMNVAVRVDSQLQSIHDLELEEEQAFQSRLRSWCGLFVSVYNGRIYFIHQTAREFLVAPQSTSSAPVSSELQWHHSFTTDRAHTVLAEICIFYLNSFNSEMKGATSYDDDRGAFIDYSARNWGFHLHDADIGNDAAIMPLAMTLCDPDSTSHSMWSSTYFEAWHDFSPKSFTGLLVASYFGLNYVVEELLEKGASTEMRDSYNWTPLSYAANRGHEAVVRLLLDKGANVEAKDAENITPLLWAAERGHEAVVRLLLIKGADIEAKGDYGWTPLLCAAVQGHKAVMRLLLDKGANIKTKDDNNRTLLLWAAKQGHEAVVRLLLDKGANIEAKCDENRTPLLWASEQGHEAVVRLLLIKSADIEAEDYCNRTPLWCAAEQGHEAVVRLLLDKGANIKAKDDKNRTLLLCAARRGREAVVRLLLDKGADIEARDDYGNTPLLCATEQVLRATQQGHEAVVRLLLDKGANVEAKDDENITPLLWAAERGHEAVVRLLLIKGADIEAKGEYGRTPLLCAAVQGHEAVMRLLLDKGANIKAKDDNNRTLLLCAAEQGHEAVVRLLLDKGADIEAKDKYGNMPLLSAAEQGHKAVMQLLLDKGANVEAKDDRNRTPLLWVAGQGHEALVRLLFDKGANADEKDDFGCTPLLWAAEQGHEAVVRLLLDKGANIEAKCDKNRTPLLWASKQGHEAVVRLLLDKGANVLEKDDSGYTPLLCAAKRGHEAVVRLLLAKGANVEAKDDHDRTPLLCAAEQGHEAVVQVLLDNVANVEARGFYNMTPLLCAVVQGHEAVVRLLLDKGANVEAKGDHNMMPLLCAAEQGHEAVVRLLLIKGADVEVKDGHSRTPLLWAAEQGHEAVLQLLLDKGANVEAKDGDYGNTPLMRAAKQGHEAVVRLLLDKGANVEAKDDRNRTPLMRAAREGHEVVVQLLLGKGADIEAKDSDGLTSLQHATNRGHDGVAQLLHGAPFSWTSETQLT